MLPERFAQAAEGARSTHLDDSARVVIDGHTRKGRQLRVYRGLAPGEDIRGSIGYFLIISANDSRAHTSKGEDVSTADVEMFPAGSVNVRHPSYGSYADHRIRVTCDVGRLAIPPEGSDERATWDGEPIIPNPTPLAAEPETV